MIVDLILSYYRATCKMFSSTIWSHKTTNSPIQISKINQNLPHAQDNNFLPIQNSYRYALSQPIKLNSSWCHQLGSKRKEKNQKISYFTKKISQKAPIVQNTMRPTAASSKKMDPIHRMNSKNHHNNYNNSTSGKNNRWKRSLRRKWCQSKRPYPITRCL